jgi:hypothetical protein
MTFAIERNFIVRASALRLSSLWPAFAPLLRFFIVVSVIRVAKTFRRSPDMVGAVVAPSNAAERTIFSLGLTRTVDRSKISSYFIDD